MHEVGYLNSALVKRLCAKIKEIRDVEAYVNFVVSMSRSGDLHKRPPPPPNVYLHSADNNANSFPIIILILAHLTTMKAIRVQPRLLRCSQTRPAIAFQHLTPGYSPDPRPISGLQSQEDAHTVSTVNLVTVSLARYPAHSHAHTRLQLRAYSTSSPDSRPRYILPKDATVDQVGKLLADFRSKMEIFWPSVLEQREVAAKERLGTRALEWVMQLKGLDETHVLSKEFCTDLTWCLVAEDKEEVLLEWLWEEGRLITALFATPPTRPRMRELARSEDPIGRRLRRRHDLFSSLINVRLCLSVDRAADSALLLLCAVHRAARNDFWTFGLAGASTALSAHLKKTQRVPCDSKLFDDFCDILYETEAKDHAPP